MKRTLTCTAIFYGILLFLSLGAHDWDPSVFIIAGERFSRRPDIFIHPLDGYDGQFYYRLALDPLGRETDTHGIRIDNPPYRQQRILYPILGWLLGHLIPLPWALLLINYVSLLAIAGLGVIHVRRAGRAPEWGLLFALWPGFLVSVTRDLVEPVAIALLLAALAATRRSRLLAASFLSLAVLARETTLLAALALPLPFALLPISIYGLWQLTLWSRWGQFPALAGQATLAFPPHLLTRGPLVPALLVVIFALLVIFSFRRSSATPGLKLAWLGYLILALLASGLVWAEPYAYLRALTEFYIVGILIVIRAR